MHLTPTAWAMKQFGGERALARALGRHRSAVHHWRKRALRGVDGAIPSDAAKIILEAAEARGIDVTARDLILGREMPDPVPQPHPAAHAPPAPVRAPARSLGR